MTTNLKDRVLKMGMWTLFGFGFAQFLRLVSNLILTRLLTPEAFGIMSVAYAVVLALAMLSDMGLRQSLVQRQSRLTEKFVDTVWTLEILRGLAICVVLLLISLCLVWVRNFEIFPAQSVLLDLRLPGVLAILALAPFITGWESTNATAAAREMNIAKLIKLQFIDALCAATATIAIAWVFQTVYAMAIGWVVGAFVRVCLSHLVLIGPGNKWLLDKDCRQEITDFGKWIFVSSAMTFAVNSGDRLLLSILLTGKELGLYAIAFLLVSTVIQLIVKLSSIGLPLFSEAARTRPQDMRILIYKARLPIDIICLLGAGFVAGGSSAIVRILYDDRYSEAAPFLSILSLLLLGTRLEIINASFIAIGKPQWLSMISFSKMFFLVSTVVLFNMQFGVIGAVWGVVAGGILPYPIALILCYKARLLDWRRELVVLPLLPAGYLMGQGFFVLYEFIFR